MSAYLSAAISIKNPEAFGRYAELVRPMIAEFGGEPVMLGQVAQVLAGTTGQTHGAMFRFPDRSAIETWYASEAYQDIIPIRDEGADVVLTIIESM